MHVRSVDALTPIFTAQLSALIKGLVIVRCVIALSVFVVSILLGIGSVVPQIAR